MARKVHSLFDKSILILAVRGSFLKLNPSTWSGIR